jgi:DNA repair photolyase
VPQPQYEGYTRGNPTVPLQERFGGTKTYAQEARSILTPASGFIAAFDFTLNPYRGCQYGCSYCYAAAFSPNPVMRQDWGNWVAIKRNAAALLERALARWSRKHPERAPHIYMSSATDPYQPIEAQRQLTRQLLAVMVRYQPTLVVQTRSPLLVRDRDLLAQLQRLQIDFSVPTGSERVRRDFEPRSPSVKARLQAVARLKRELPGSARFVITMTPLLPTFPQDEAALLERLAVADRVVLQPFHASDGRTLAASTRSEGVALKQHYRWWYANEQSRYRAFRERLRARLKGVTLAEGKAGFGYIGART